MVDKAADGKLKHKGEPTVHMGMQGGCFCRLVAREHRVDVLAKWVRVLVAGCLCRLVVVNYIPV